MVQNSDKLAAASGLLALITAAVHLSWGIPRFVNYASVGLMPDPRPVAFVLSGHAIALAVTLVLLDIVDARRLFLPGAVLMVVHLVGYAAWHTVLSHGARRAGHDHVHIGAALLDVLVHVVTSPLVLVSKVAELGVLVLLVLLFVATRTD